MALISLTEKQQEILEGFVRRRKSQQWLSKRAMIILQLNLGASIKETSRRLSLSRNTVRTWYRRWKESEDNLFSCEKQDDKEFPLGKQIKTILSDVRRCGRPPTFSPEEIVQIVVIACEKPQKFGRPISHWTTRELADEVVKQGIVKSVSPRSVGRFLKGVDSSAASQPLLASSKHRRRTTVPSTNNRNLSSLPAGFNSPRWRQPSDQL
jgi:putative transposase